MKVKSLKAKLVLLVLCSMVPLILGVFLYAIPNYENFFMEQKKKEIKTAVEVATGMLSVIDAKVKAGQINFQQAKQESQKLFETLRYGETKKDYFFAYQNGIGMAHGIKPTLVGQDRTKATDSNGKNYMKNFMEIESKKSFGYVDYKFIRKNGKTSEDKLSYILYFAPWKWIVGSGVYLSDVQDQMKAIKIKIYVGIAFIIIAALGASLFYSIKLSKNLSTISNGLQLKTDSIDDVAKKLSSISESLSSSATQQASALQQTSSSVEETSAMIERNTQNAKESILISRKSQNSVNEGKESLNNVMSSIEDIATSNTDILNQVGESNKELENIVKVINDIGEKTKVINDIVFQTKLLSFNASVEAARAGEQGKGFAVVAEEVGNLATMSGNSANEITEMLDKSIVQVDLIIKSSKDRLSGLVVAGEEKVKSGLETVNQCKNIFDTIVVDVDKVTSMVEDISSASDEQSTGVQEINSAVGELDSSAQQNSAMSQDTSDTADELRKEVLTLKEMTIRLNNTLAG